MSLIDVIYLTIAAAMIVLSLKNWRGILWIVALTISYFVSGALWRDTGNAALFTLLCDTAVFLAIYAVGRHLWEIWLLGIQFAMMAASCLLTAFQFDMEIYQVSLEVLNLAALLLIGGTGAYILAGYSDARAFHHVRHLMGFGFVIRGQGSQR